MRGLQKLKLDGLQIPRLTYFDTLSIHDAQFDIWYIVLTYNLIHMDLSA